MQNKDEIFKSVFFDYQDRIYRLVWSFLEDKNDLDDLFQSVLLKIWKNLDSFKNRSSLGTWIYRITVNTLIDFRRDKKRKQDITLKMEIENEKIQDEDQDIEQKMIKNERLEILNYCIKQLSLIDRTLIVLYLEELKYSEIADVLGISEKNVSVKLARIKKKMNRMLR